MRGSSLDSFGHSRKKSGKTKQNIGFEEEITAEELAAQGEPQRFAVDIEYSDENLQAHVYEEYA